MRSATKALDEDAAADVEAEVAVYQRALARLSPT